MRRGLGQTLENGTQIADRDLLSQQALKDALQGGDGDDGRNQFLDQLLLFGPQFPEQLLHLGIGQKVRHVLLEDFGQVGGQHRGRIDDRVATEGGLLAQAFVDPGGGQAEGRLLGVFARQLDLTPGRVHGHQGAETDLAGACLHLLDADGVGLGAEPHVVEDAHRRHDEAILLGQGSAQGADLVGQAATLEIIDQGQQGIAQLDLDLIDGQGGADGLLDIFLRAGGGGQFALGRHGLESVTAQPPGHETCAEGQGCERQQGHAGDQADQAGGGGNHAEADGVRGQLGHEGLVCRALDAGL